MFTELSIYIYIYINLREFVCVFVASFETFGSDRFGGPLRVRWVLVVLEGGPINQHHVTILEWSPARGQFVLGNNEGYFHWKVRIALCRNILHICLVVCVGDCLNPMKEY